MEFWGRLDKNLTPTSGNFAVSYARQTTQFDELLFGMRHVSSSHRLALFVDGVALNADITFAHDRAWHHFATTWQSSDGTAKLYQDGVFIKSGVIKVGYSVAAGGVIVLGQDQDSAGGGFQVEEAWAGELDDVRVYTRVLSDREIREHVAGTFTDDTDLVLNVTLDDASNLGKDYSTAANDLTVTGISDPTRDVRAFTFDPRIKQPSAMTRDAFDAGTTQGRTRVGYGDLVLLNGDGLLDGIKDYGLDGRPIVIRRGAPNAVYPGGFQTVLVGTMEQPEVTTDLVTVKLRDRQAELEVALQPTKYLGDNALPAGLEGVASDLKGKPKPLCYGVVKNVPAVLVNSAKLIYQVHDGAVASVDAVYDRGILLGFIFVTHAGGVSAYSHNGAYWKLSSLSGWTGVVDDVMFGAGVFVITGSAGQISTSPDGITWTSRTSGTANELFGVTFGEGLFVAVGGGSPGTVLTSPDGVTWTARTSNWSFGGAIISVNYGNGIFMATGSGGGIITSPDGITWTARTAIFAGTIAQDLAWGNGVWVVVGDRQGAGDGKIAYSTDDGVNFTDATTTPPFDDKSVFGISFGANMFLAVGDSGRIGRSTDGGVTWQQVTSLGTQILLHSEYSAGQFLISGFEGLLATSFDGVLFTRQIQYLYPADVFGPNSIRGIAGGQLDITTYASQAALLDDTLAPLPGRFKVYPAGGYFRLGATPAGLITADVTEGSAASDRTAAQIFKRALVRAGKTAADYSAADISALDAAEDAVLGYWTNEETTFAALFDQIAASVGAWWGVDRLGVFRIKQLVAPAGPAIVAFTANDLTKPLNRLAMNDPGRGLPRYRSTLKYGRIYTVQTADLALGVTQDRRNVVGREWREVSSTDATGRTTHLLAPEITEVSLMQVEADAQGEVNRRQTLRGVQRDPFELEVELNDETSAVDLGHVIRLTHGRYALSAGKLFVVLRVAPDTADRRLLLNVWG
jgi:hypothetical protein